MCFTIIIVLCVRCMCYMCQLVNIFLFLGDAYNSHRASKLIYFCVYILVSLIFFFYETKGVIIIALIFSVLFFICILSLFLLCLMDLVPQFFFYLVNSSSIIMELNKFCLKIMECSKK